MHNIATPVHHASAVKIQPGRLVMTKGIERRSFDER